MADKPEQICKGEWSVNYKRFLKKTLRRFRRREEKRLLDDAGKKSMYRGWSN